MTWITFMMWLLAIYSFYYTLIFAYDFYRTRDNEFAGTAKPGAVEFPPEILAELIKDIHLLPDEDEIDYFTGEEESEPASFSSGGVSLKELFELARSESIEFTHQVSF